MSDERPAPGAASHYRGAAAEDYLAYQRSIGELGATLNRWKFEPHVGPGDRVVDFGCGTGGLLAGLDVAQRTGVEPSEPARAAAAARGLTVLASAAELPDGAADVVISNHALEHATAPLAELRELRRALRPGGRLVLWLPLDDWRVQRHPDPGEPDHHLYAWTPRLLANLLAEAGFEGVDCEVVTRAWPPRAHLLVRLPRPVFDALGRVWAVVRRRRQLAAVAHRPG
ncbi:MAG: methyltransferase domain-containing protein [Solirubrobacterales bacterium]|nr:methyltransferase domain-containing protein [Solirubrobacterales bacterium]